MKDRGISIKHLEAEETSDEDVRAGYSSYVCLFSTK